MNNSILNASKNSQGLSRYVVGYRKYAAIVTVLLLAGGPFVYGYISKNKEAASSTAKLSEAAAKKTDLQISISGDGRLVADKNIELLFSSVGTIKEVFVKDGQTVKKGDKIASLDTAELALALASAQTSKSIAVANLLSRQAGPSQFDVELTKKNIVLAEKRLADVRMQNVLDIKNAELTLKTAQLNLAAAENNLNSNASTNDLDLVSLDLKIKQSYDDAIVKTALALTEVENALKETGNILNTNNDFSSVLGALNLATKYDVESSYSVTLNLKDKYLLDYQNVKIGSAVDLIMKKLTEAIKLAESASQMIHKTSAVLDATVTTSALTQSELDTYKSSALSEHAKIKTQIEVLNNTKQTIDSALVDKRVKEASGQNSATDVETKIDSARQQYEGAKLQLENIKAKAAVNEREAVNQLEVSKIQLSMKTEPVRDVDVASLRAQISQTQNQIDEARYRLSLGTIIAPTDGVIAGVSGKPGDIYADKNKVFATLVNKNNFSMEAYIEEVDIAKIKQEQKVYLTFDALDGVKLEGVVNFISEVPKIDSNGLVTYLVRTIIVDTKNDGIKDGMTAYAEFVLTEAKGVLTVPVAAVKNISGKSSVELASGELRTVETGFTDGKSVEIISGLSASERVKYVE